MKVLSGFESLRDMGRPAAVTIGTFDGVHYGHRALIEETKRRATELDAVAVAVTWDRHPAATLRPEAMPPMLCSTDRKVELLAETGLDGVVVLPFDERLSHWPPERFVTDVLVDGLAARAVLVGGGWRFGHKAAGDVALLAQLGKEHGFSVEGVDLAEVGGQPVSSSRVRKAILAGDMDEARLLLGRPFDWDGMVVRGDDRGAGLGFPTANVEVDDHLAHPPIGVYAGRARVPGPAWHPAAVNLGVNPTFGEGLAAPRIEAYVLDYSGDLYGVSLRIEFWARLRDELRFDSAADLVRQIAADVAATRSLVEGTAGR